jgi:hypothetical protein
MFSKLFSEILTRRKRDTRHVEAEAFYQGAHGVEIKPGLEEIQARFDKQGAQLNQRSIEIQKKFETILDHVKELWVPVEKLCLAVRERIGDRIPPFLLPLVIALGAVFIAVAEVILLAPALDLMNVTEYRLQVFSAIGILLIGGLSYHFAWETLSSAKFTSLWRWTIRLVAILVTVALVYWGVLRGMQVAFAAKVMQNPLGDFLSAHPVASAVFYVFITLAAPVMIAAATHYSFHHLRDWWEWKTSNSRMNRLIRLRVSAQKGLESEKERLIHGLKEIAHECAEWKATYRLNHQRGGKHGAIQEPYWMVPLKATLAMLVVLAFFWWLPLPVLGVIDWAIWIAAFLYFRRQWHSPSPEEFFELEHVSFAVPAKDQTDDNPLLAPFRSPKELSR